MVCPPIVLFSYPHGQDHGISPPPPCQGFPCRGGEWRRDPGLGYIDGMIDHARDRGGFAADAEAICGAAVAGGAPPPRPKPSGGPPWRPSTPGVSSGRASSAKAMSSGSRGKSSTSPRATASS